MAVWKEIKSRIKSVKNIGKITKAMELISTVKMRRAQENVLELRPFALATLEILRNISGETNVFGSYTEASDTPRELVILIASSKGLCGGYNVNTFKQMVEYARSREGIEFDYITVGKRAREFVLRIDGTLLADFSEDIHDGSSVSETRKLVRFILDAWDTGKYRKVSLLYNQYVSAITQVPLFKTMFPINADEISAFLAHIVGDMQWDAVSIHQHQGEFTIEPSPRLVFEYAIPMILDAIVHESILEALASEHAARMVAMKNAKDAAKSKASALTLAYNKARQWAITTEITEIVSGVESMKD